MKFLARGIGIVFFVVSILASLVLFFYYCVVLRTWLGGFLGTLVAIFTSPSVFVFPFVYWLVERAFPVFYFELLGICFGSLMVGYFLWSVGSDSN